MRRLCVALLFVTGLSVTTIGAGEWVSFVDGRFLEVQSHSREGDVMLLKLDRSSWVMIPADTVETIERARRIVYRREDHPAILGFGHSDPLTTGRLELESVARLRAVADGRAR